MEPRLLDSYTELTYTPELIKESVEKTGKIILNGILQKADTLNQNGRIYPSNILEREVRNYQKFIIENRSTGELDHPEASVVSFQKVSHIVREAVFNDKIVTGKVEILNTPNGKIVQDLLAANVKIGISSRGVGSTKKEGDYYVVQDDFQLICWDIVSDPSTPGAFMLPEGRKINLENMQSINKLFNKSDRIYRIINDILSSK